MATKDQKDHKGQNLNQSSSKKGFAGMDPEEQREISAKGGRASHQNRNEDESEMDTKDGNRKPSQASSNAQTQGSRGRTQGSNLDDEEDDDVRSSSRGKSSSSDNRR